MSDLPEILSGAIANEHRDSILASWFAHEPEHKHKEKTEDRECSRDCDMSTGTTPTDCGVTCDEPCKPEKRHAAFRPTVAGWFTPPPVELG